MDFSIGIFAVFLILCMAYDAIAIHSNNDEFISFAQFVKIICIVSLVIVLKLDLIQKQTKKPDVEQRTTIDRSLIDDQIKKQQSKIIDNK